MTQDLQSTYDDPNNAPERPGRRDFLKKALVAGAGAALAPLAQAAGQPNDLVAAFGNQRFKTLIDGEDRIVTMADLQNMLSTKATIVSFGYGTCTKYCSSANPVLAQFSNDANIVTINVRPQTEGKDLKPGQKTWHQETMEAVNVKNPLVLLPIDNNGAFLSDEEIYEIQRNLAKAIEAKNDRKMPGFMVNESQFIENGHTNQAVLFDRRGTLKAQATVTEASGMHEKMDAIIAANRPSGIIRQ